MTTAQKQGALTLLASFAIPLLIAAATIGAARQQLADKEDAGAHALDLRDVRTEMALTKLRDSARMEIVLQRITEVACDQNPARRYCR